jgi:broad-specificity NMP kinase
LFIAVEGVDGAGKTTFVKALAEEIKRVEAGSKTPRPVRMVHHGPPQDHPLVEYEMAFDSYDPRGEHVVIDRYHFGELIYPELYRDGSLLGRAGLWHVDKYMQSNGGIMCVLMHDPYTLRQRLKTRGEDFINSDHIEKLLEMYQRVILDSCLDSIVLTDPGRAEIQGIVLDGYLEESRATELHDFPTYIGPHEPDFLLFGDERKDPSYRAAFVPHSATSGRYLLDALTPYVARRCGIANATEEDCAALWDTLGKPPVVALGRNAESALKKAKVPHGAVPHPQYVRRFVHSKKCEYGWAISQALHDYDFNWKVA